MTQFWILDCRFSIERSESRKIFCLILCAVLFALCVPAQAQNPAKFPRVGYLSGVDPATDSPRAEGIRRALRELGYVDGQNVAFEYRHADGKRGQQKLASDLVSLKVDLIVVAGGDGGIQAAMNATNTIPIVMTGQGSDPVKAGFVKSLARPGGNVTGLTILSRELGGKRLELFKEAVPRLIRVAVLYQASVPGTAREVKEDLPPAARALGLVVQPWEVRDTDDFANTLVALSKDRPDGVYSPGGGRLMRTNVKQIASFALKNRLPSLFSEKEGVDAGGLMQYGADQDYSYRRIAYYIDKILKGAKPNDLPVEQATKLELVINLKTAKQIGLTISPNVLARADRVIR